MGILELITSIGQSIAGWFGFSRQKDEQLNSVAMQKNKDAAIDQKSAEENADIVSKGDLEKIRDKAA